MVSFISLFQYRKLLTGLYKELEEERSASVDAYINAGKVGELAHEETMIIIGALGLSEKVRIFIIHTCIRI
ncbi:hypothetical protein BRARA_J01516 [Brassica rapa]|uniref:Uncharacterized protein n=1 Tax=Brassica campestris TaxID=3711 RepID=A0A397XUT6_BRACM|nr:hypothetical protein BRARA_J01516 [Brassica rapa]